METIVIVVMLSLVVFGVFIVVYLRRRSDAKSSRTINLEDQTRDQVDESQKEIPQELPTTEKTKGKMVLPECEDHGIDLEVKEKEQQRIEEEHGLSGKDAHPTEEVTSEENQKKDRTIAPKDRGGRRRGSTQGRDTQKRTSKPKSPRMKPEIICWKRERQWISAVELPEELLGTRDLTVFQNTSPLTEDELKEGCWQLRQATGQVVVRWNEDGVTRENEITLGEENYLLFKLNGQDQSQGRHVKFPLTGSYLVVIPDNWARDEALSGAPPVAPETTSFAGYQAHFYFLDKDNDGKIVFRTMENEIITIESKASRFKLDGKLLDDANENMGPLFGMIPPRICAVSDEAWADVEIVVVGEEGGGRDRWRTIFTPVRGLVEQDLPSEVAARKAGWYFLRFYDANDDLVESLDFRFVEGLKDIKVHQPPSLPLVTGHASVSAEFLHEPGCNVQPADSFAGSVSLAQKDDRTILAIPPDPASDKTRWLVGSQNGPQLELCILVERLWWAVGEEDEVPREWKDTHFALSRDNFAATSNNAIWVRLPRPRWIDAVSIGFEQQKSRRFTLKVAENTIAIPLREFADTHEVADRTKDHHLKVWVKRDDKLFEGVIAAILTDLPITPAKQSPITEMQRDSSEKKAFLPPGMISTPRLASVLTKLRRTTRGPLRFLIKEVRRDYHRGSAARQAESVEFVKKALCMLAMYLELCDEKRSKTSGLKKYRIDQASLAKDKYPEIMVRLKDRYKALNSGRAHRDSGMRQRR